MTTQSTTVCSELKTSQSRNDDELFALMDRTGELEERGSFDDGTYTELLASVSKAGGGLSELMYVHKTAIRCGLRSRFVSLPPTNS